MEGCVRVMPYNADVPDYDNFGVQDLNDMRENFQILEDLANDKENILEISELAPYKNIIADNRIVEHNLDISNPSNGYYVRWENGLQVAIIASGQKTITGLHSELFDHET